ncbi:MAG: hypothetical protein IJT76_06035 [Clostridia bacterium]|nr:hypothetical protein [Clostridia bacterium]
MTQDPFYRIAALMMESRRRELGTAVLECAAEARFLMEGAAVRAAVLPEGMTLTAADEGKRYVCLTGEDGLIPLCALAEERME